MRDISRQLLSNQTQQLDNGKTMKNHPSEILPGLKMHKTRPQLALGLFFVVGMLLVPDARAQSYAMSNLWTVVAGAPSHPFMSTNDNATRGIAYSPATDHVLVPAARARMPFIFSVARRVPFSERSRSTPIL